MALRDRSRAGRAVERAIRTMQPRGTLAQPGAIIGGTPAPGTAVVVGGLPLFILGHPILGAVPEDPDAEPVWRI